RAAASESEERKAWSAKLVDFTRPPTEAREGALDRRWRTEGVGHVIVAVADLRLRPESEIGRRRLVHGDLAALGDFLGFPVLCVMIIRVLGGLPGRLGARAARPGKKRGERRQAQQNGTNHDRKPFARHWRQAPAM